WAALVRRYLKKDCSRMVTFISRNRNDQQAAPRIVRVPVTQPPVAAVVSSPDDGASFTIAGMSRIEATHLAILIAENARLGYIAHDLGAVLFPRIEVTQ